MPRKARFNSVADEQQDHHGVAAVDRALTILLAFEEGDASLSLIELAQRTKLYKSTVLRMLASLIHSRLVQRLEDRRYGLGPEISRLQSIYAASFSLDRFVMPVLRELVTATGESAAYHVTQGNARLCLYRVDSPQPIRDHIKAGDLLPLDRGAGGRVLTAFGTAFSKGLPRETRAQLAQIRKDGYFGGIGDRAAGVGGISAPVFDKHRALAGAVTLTMPAHRFDNAYVVYVVDAARRIGEFL